MDDNKGISTITYTILGKPQQITFTDGRAIVYTYSADGNKLKMSVTQSGTTTHTDYVGSFVYENSALSFFGAPEGRVVKNGSNYEYQYAIGDHQGNTRVVFSSAPPPVQSATAAFEVSAQSNEATKFQNYPSVSGINPVSSNNSTPGGTSSQYLHGGLNGQVGVAKSFKVFPGDQVKIEAYARYTEGSGPGNLENFATALLAAFNLAPPGGGETGTASSAVNTWGTVEAGGYAHGLSNTYPKAFVNIILFDQNYNLIDAGYMQVTSSGSPAYISKSYTVKEAGYAYLYVSNENATIVDVYFDDVTMTYTPGNVVQYNEYYPFGLRTANSWTRENTTGNSFLGNGGTELNKTSSLYDLSFRNYDPILGRMNGVDPVAGKYSSLTPYNFAFNDPVSFSDPSGADPGDVDDPWNGGSYYGSYTQWYNGGNRETMMDPFGGSGYGTAGYTGMYGLGGIISSYNPDYGGWEYLGQDANGNTIKALPSEIARAGGAQSYLNIAYNYSLGMSAFGMVETPLGRGHGTSGYFPLVNGGLDLENAEFYRWSIDPAYENIVAKGPGDPNDPRNVSGIPSRRAYEGFWGVFQYMWDGGYENGVYYDRSGKPLFKGKMLTGTPPDFIGGPNAVAKGAVWLAQMANKYKGAQTSATQIGKLHKYTVSVPGKNGHTVYTKILNAEGKTLKWFHDTYDKTGKFMHRGWTEGSQKAHLWWDGFIQTVGPYIPR